MSGATDRAQAPPRDPAASMSLITELMKNPLDPAYRQEADRRAAAGGSRDAASSGHRSPILIAVVILLGFALATAVSALRVPRTHQDRQRASLISRIHQEQGDIAASSRQITGLRGEISTLQNKALARNNGASTAAQLNALGASTGLVAVHGPGVVLSVDNAPSGSAGAGVDPRHQQGSDTTSAEGQVASADLQLVVDGMWQGGAEAIAINGQRLTAQSAIRSAGEAILVNFQPLQPPYIVSAIGPPSLRTAFEDSEGGVYLHGLATGYGIRTSLRSDSSLKLPAAVVADLRYAKAAQ
ncbi:DUF881 domain-containing protein [Allobranchiibius sp. GilTou73]|uniref:DUF881 domain-containing protein n=1 Tax=Allobranchiibius sp. GilTou73 TaxID=2904523 RepID=UPI001F2B8602|nr:DUF881 domain-containing protein [Allobranchiibius sp. GilTou73]UIJ34043.1 DUF881 domain-containing protein [Allobranchiibius sp. GilTou73]